MGVDGDGDLGAVVWGVGSAPSPAFGLQRLHSDHATVMSGTSSSWAQSVVHSRSGAAMDMTRLRSSGSDSKSVKASAALASLLPQTHASSSIKVTSLDRSGGTLSELIPTLGAGSNSSTGMGELSTSASTLYSNIVSDNRSSLYPTRILEKPARSTPQEVRSTPQVLSCTSFSLTGSISGMIDESLHFGASELFTCPSPATFEGPVFEECSRLSSSEEANLRTAMTGKSLDPSAQARETLASMELPPPAPKSIECKLGSKRRKMQQKRIVHVPLSGGGRPSGEVLPSDMWAWRKYGQKPIKGSPYPRGYYRCSSSKDCSARKQVERSQTDPSMLIITYTSEHNHSWPAHRNSLAGTTRPKSSPEKSVATFCSDVATHPPHHLSGSITNTGASQTCLLGHTSLLAKHTIALGQDSGTLDTISRSSSQEEEIFPALDGVPEFSSALRKNVLDEKSDDEGGNVEVDPYNLFCWSSGGLPAC